MENKNGQPKTVLIWQATRGGFEGDIVRTFYLNTPLGVWVRSAIEINGILDFKELFMDGYFWDGIQIKPIRVPASKTTDKPAQKPKEKLPPRPIPPVQGTTKDEPIEEKLGTYIGIGGRYKG